MIQNIIKKTILLLILPFILISCLEIDTTINLEEDNSGSWSLMYRIMQEALYITPGNELEGYNYFPSDETEIRERIDAVSGLDLISLSTNTTILYNEFRVEMSFNSLNTIELFFNNFTSNNLIEIILEDTGEWNLIINSPFSRTDNIEGYNLISSLYPNKTARITVFLPGIVTQSNQGLLADDPSTASVSVKIVDILNLTEPFLWIVNYE
jgi:hypothetical protein